MEKGQLIEFRLQGERRLAVIERPEGKKDWVALDERGNPHKIRPQQIEYQIEGGPYKFSEIPTFLKEVNQKIDRSSLEVAWEILIEEDHGISSKDLAQLLFSETTPLQCYLAHDLLVEDKIYFKRKGELYEPRSSNQVEEIKHQQSIEEQKQQEKQEFILKLLRAQAKEKVEWTENDRNRLEGLERYVLQPEQINRNAQELLTIAGKPLTSEAAYELILELGWWKQNENLFLRRSSYPNQFSKKALTLSQSYLASPPVDSAESDRIDLTELKVYTIDDESTLEIDDGLSIEYLNDGRVKIWVHIADPTRLVAPGDELDLEARKRSTTLYLPTGMISMFPPELATGPMSLIQGKKCPALSFSVILDEVGAIKDYAIYSSFIKPTYRLTYEDVDEMLHLEIQAEEEISTLAQLAKLRHQWRKSQGAINISMPEAIIKVSEDDQIKIDLLETSIARQLVAEMMIMTGEVTGKYCKKHQIPVPFRGQPQPDLPSEEELIILPAGPVRSCAIRRCMPRSEIGITPNRHASLGLETYIQVTSPIRRYTDLLTHFQLKAHLKGALLPFTAEQMQEIIYSVTAASIEAISVERQTNRYWSLEYLRRNSEEVWQVMLLRWLREDENLGLILLEELGLELPHRFDRNVALGDRLSLQVSRSDPQRDEIRFKEPIQK
jgi:exoribonuclease-2